MQVSQGLVLTTWQRIVALVTSIAIILGGIGAAAQGWAAYSDWACQLGAWSPRACPADSEDGTPGNTTHHRDGAIIFGDLIGKLDVNGPPESRLL